MARTSVVLLVGEQTSAGASLFPAVSSSMPLRASGLLARGRRTQKRVKKDTFLYSGGSVASVPMATEKAETDRVPVTLALSTISYLEKLVRQGTHGTSVPGVAKTLIEEGIRLAIKDGLLAVRDNSKVSTQER